MDLQVRSTLLHSESQAESFPLQPRPAMESSRDHPVRREAQECPQSLGFKVV
jgi:hypothetical protein